MVFRGSSQIEGIDYKYTYALLLKGTSTRVLSFVVALFDVDLHEMDVVTFFLNGET